MDQKTKIRISYRVAVVSGVFCVVLSLLLLLNFWDLREEVKSFDLLVRKAYYTSRWQIITGTCLLLIGGIFLVISLKIYADLRLRIEHTEKMPQNYLKVRTNSQYWLFLTGGLVLGLAFSTAFLNNAILNDYKQLVYAERPVEVKSDVEEAQIFQSEGSIPGVETALEETESPPLAGSETVSDGDPEVQVTKEKGAVGALGPQAYKGIEEFKKNHNTFRGFFGQGISYHRNIPVNWNCFTGQNVKWRVKFSKPGTNSPVIWEDKLFISGADAQSRILACYDRFTGQLLWEKEVKDIPGSPATPPKEYPETGLAAPTMAVDGHRVYAIFGTGDLIAFDLDGTRIWGRNLGVPVNPYNHSSSLVVWQEKLVIQYDTRAGGRMLTVNTATGKTIWDITRPVQISWASPVLIQEDGKIQIVTTADPYVAGYDLETGRELWKVEGMMGEVATSVAYDDGFVFANSAYAKLICIKPEPGASYIWEDDEYLSEIPSPVAYKGLLYVPTNYGDLVCYDAKTGEKYWEKWFDEEIYSSPMIADGKLYLIDKAGNMHILKADKTGTVISEPEMGEGGFALPAFAEGLIYLRGTSNLYCIGE
jgi:outer membrane protein assembly factor BamB